VKVLVIDPFLPLHDIASGSLRLFRIIKLIIGLGAKVTYLAINAHNQQRYAAELRGFGVRVIEGHKAMLEKLGYSSDAADFDFKELLIRERFSHAWLSFFHTAEHYLDQIREYLPTTKIIVDSVDVHFVRELRQALRPEGRPVDLEKALDTKVREVKIYNSSDRTIVVSQDDQSALMDAGVVSPISIISNIHDALLNDEATFPTRNGIIFVGNFNHIPNADGIRWFLKNVWPLIHSELPHATLDIIGPNPPEDLLKITSDGIRVRGWVPDLKPYYDNAKVSIAPLRFGAGVKGKVGDSLARGTPVVLTSIAAEGMKLPSSLREFVQDDEAGFAMAVVRLHQDERLWGCIRQEGRSHISQLFGSEVAARGLIDVLALRQNLTKKSTEVVI
jgi:glycosyltransferase involved in cell wall biosynthesis